MPLPPTRVTLDRVALTAVLAMPLLLLHAHGFAEVAIGIADGCFLAGSVISRDWRWLRSGWMQIGLIWWGWLVICSLPIPALGVGLGGLPSLVQALAMLRFLVFSAALEYAVLRNPGPRRWMYRLIAATAVYIGVHALFQFATGFNLYGVRPHGFELTGPFAKPRAGPPLSRVLFPALLPPAATLLERRGIWPRIAAYALLLLGVGVMVLIGQRMPLLLTFFGLLVCGLLVTRLRPVVLAAIALGVALVAASFVIAPHAYDRLVLQFSDQMEHFPTSQYGLVYARAWEIGVQHPLTGRGADGFRTGCENPRYFRPSFDHRLPDGGGAEVCVGHPHNFYFQALADSGFVGLVLFCALAIAWLLPLARGLWRSPDPLRVGLFASILIQLWPIASTSAFQSMPMGGWFFLLLGWGLAEARWRVQPHA
jgi:O-antigen ligase